MKELVEYLSKKKIVCKRLETVAPKELESRKRVGVYRGVGIDGYYCSVFLLRKKSRVLRKEAEELMELQRRLAQKIDAVIKRNYLLYDAPICSKAKAFLEEKGWKVYPLEG